MYKFITQIIVFLSIPLCAYSVDAITTPLILEDSQKKFNKLEFGVRSDASDTVDLDLGENFDLPGPPPGGLHAYFRIFNPVSEETTSSYLDFKAMPSLRTEPVVFTLHTFYVVEFIKFRWEPFDQALVDSAFIEDIYGAGVKIDMLEDGVATVDNPSITKFNIRIWFSHKVANVDESEENHLSIYPVPASDQISVISDMIGSKYSIYNMYGMVICKGRIEDSSQLINISSLESGSYIIGIENSSMKVFKSIIILN